MCGYYEKKLLNDLIVDYNALERPVVNESEPLLLTFGITLQQIIDVVSLVYKTFKWFPFVTFWIILWSHMLFSHEFSVLFCIFEHFTSLKAYLGLSTNQLIQVYLKNAVNACLNALKPHLHKLFHLRCILKSLPWLVG